MKLLVDACVSGRVAEELRAAGHDVVWVGDWTTDPGDVAILAEALRDQRVVITLDNDFGELAVFRRLPHAGIIRIDEPDFLRHTEICLGVLERHADDLAAGAIAAAEWTRVRLHLTEN